MKHGRFTITYALVAALYVGAFGIPQRADAVQIVPGDYSHSIWLNSFVAPSGRPNLK